jgi:hypothetical protein
MQCFSELLAAECWDVILNHHHGAAIVWICSAMAFVLLLYAV